MSGQPTVLMVDDKSRLDGSLLFNPDSRVGTVADRASGLAFLRANPDVGAVLINLETAPEEGLLLLSDLRAWDAPDRPAVAFCADAGDEATIERAYQLGADEVLLRPFSPSILRRQAARLLERSAAPCPDAAAGGKPALETPADSRLLTELVDAVPSGVALYDVTGTPRLLYGNETLRRMCGYTGDEYDRLMAEDYHRLIDPADHETVDRLIEDYRRRPRPMEKVFRARAGDGGPRWICLCVTPHGDGSLCKAVYLDVTRHRELEAGNERMRSALRYREEFDTLTGIANRESFYRNTAELLHAHPDTPYVIMLMDIDRFKVINERFGRDVGDRILVAIARGLSRMLNGIGTCARLESDHFAACYPSRLLDMDRVIRLFDKGLRRQNLDYHIQLFFGICNVLSADTPVAQMCDWAAMALQTVKAGRVKPYAVFDDRIRQTLLEENSILDEMHQALDSGQFEPFLQPIFSVDGLQPVGAELLARWRHPVKGLIPPQSFIPLFERIGFVTQLDFFLWEQACAMLARWQREGRLLPVSVNISRVDLYSPRLCERLVAITNRHGVSPELIRLEITESAYSQDSAALADIIGQLRKAGFLVMMDDFGSGYSSLNVLMDMPVDILKLDMRFLAKLDVNPRAASILTSVVRMAKWLHMPMVAEGVETREQLAFLRSIGCDHAQGYLFARPVSVGEFEERFLTAEGVCADTGGLRRRESVDLSAFTDVNDLSGAMFNGMVGGMGIYELCGDALEVRRVNDGYYELFGCTPKQVFDGDREALFTVHPDDRDALLAACRQAAQSGRVERCVCRHIRRRNGRQMWLEARLRHMGNAGENGVFCLTFSDVTEQKEFEQASALRDYATVLRSVYASVYEINIERQTYRAVSIADAPSAADTPHQPWAPLRERMEALLPTKDEELQRLIFEPGYLRDKLRENRSDFYQVERKVLTEGRQTRWASFTLIRMPAAVGDEVYLLCVADVHNRKRADDLAQENQWLQLKREELAHYQALLEHLGTSLFEWDAQTGRQTASHGFERYALSAFDFHTLTSHKDLERYICAADLNVFRHFVNDLLAHGSGAVTLRLLEAAGGDAVWCRVMCTFIAGEDGRACRCIGAINQIDEQVKVRENYLDEQTRFQNFADNSLAGFGIFEMRGEEQRILYLSNGYRKMVGYAPDEPFAAETEAFRGVYEEDVPRFREAAVELSRTGKPFTIEYRVPHRDGTLRWMRSLNSLYPGPSPGVSRIFAVMEDITELRSLQTQMHTLTEALPIGFGIYRIGGVARPAHENTRMRTMLTCGAEARAARDTLEQAGVFARLAAGMPGDAPLDSVISLSDRDGGTARFRILARAVADGVGLDCYCAVLRMASPDGALDD